MFEHNLTQTKHFTTKAHGEESYYDFLRKVGLKKEGFPFIDTRQKNVSGHDLRLKVTSWGSYINADNEWRIFIAWREIHSGFTKMMSWSWDGELSRVIDVKIDQFLP